MKYRSYATCTSSVDVVAALVYKNNVATLTRDNCQDLAVPVTVPPEAIQFASNNSAMLLYDGKIFDQQTAAPAQTITVSFCQTNSVHNAVWLDDQRFIRAFWKCALRILHGKSARS